MLGVHFRAKPISSSIYLRTFEETQEMKYSLAIAAMVVFGTAAAAVAEDGRVSQNQLAEFGLAGMNSMSDTEAEQVRGQGFAFAGSLSASAVPGAFNVSPAVAFGSNEAIAVTGSTSSLSARGAVFGVGGPPPSGFLLGFRLRVRASSAGFAYASAN